MRRLLVETTSYLLLLVTVAYGYATLWPEQLTFWAALHHAVLVLVGGGGHAGSVLASQSGDLMAFDALAALLGAVARLYLVSRIAAWIIVRSLLRKLSWAAIPTQALEQLTKEPRQQERLRALAELHRLN